MKVFWKNKSELIQGSTPKRANYAIRPSWLWNSQRAMVGARSKPLFEAEASERQKAGRLHFGRTGFALKYPDTWWARPLLILEGSHSMRSIIHRVAAVIFIAVSVTHLVSLIVSRKLRQHWKEMLPQVRDAREAAAGFVYNVGVGSVPPERSAHSYVEKAEYWAVVWGAVVMASTGLMLWANNLAMRFLPEVS